MISDAACPRSVVRVLYKPDHIRPRWVLAAGKMDGNVWQLLAPRVALPPPPVAPVVPILVGKEESATSLPQAEEALHSEARAASAGYPSVGASTSGCRKTLQSTRRRE